MPQEIVMPVANDCTCTKTGECTCEDMYCDCKCECVECEVAFFSLVLMCLRWKLRMLIHRVTGVENNVKDM